MAVDLSQNRWYNGSVKQLWSEYQYGVAFTSWSVEHMGENTPNLGFSKYRTLIDSVVGQQSPTRDHGRTRSR